MGWDTPGGYRDPKEVRAAEEAARHAEAERAVQDARTATIAEAVRAGFADLAAAIVTAAGLEVAEVWRQRQHDLRDDAPFGHVPEADCALGADPHAFNEARAQIDSDIDDLIDNQE